jgi:3-hydroxyisobutyrate dehydrogenase-like beta-hydroxyacid dehydrogenase
MRIGFVGAGTMGRPMAENLLAKGHEVILFDRDPSALAVFANRARLAGSAAECAECDGIIVMVAFDDQVREVVKEVALAASGKRRSVIAVMSTVLPDTMTDLLPVCQSRGIGLIDAPVMGMPARAAAGTLVVIAGGDATDIEYLRPAFEAFTTEIFHMGALTRGQVTKLINNMIAVSNLFMFGEALNLGNQFGLDTSKLVSVMESGGGRSFFTKNWDQSRHNLSVFCRNRDSIKTIVDICRKDVDHAMALASIVKLAAPFLAGTNATTASLSYDDVLARWRSILAPGDRAE